MSSKNNNQQGIPQAREAGSVRRKMIKRCYPYERRNLRGIIEFGLDICKKWST